MNRQTLADVLQSTSQTGSYTLATVLEGAEAGSQLLLRDGDALQSCGLRFVHPDTGKPMAFSLPLPAAAPWKEFLELGE